MGVGIAALVSSGPPLARSCYASHMTWGLGLSSDHYMRV